MDQCTDHSRKTLKERKEILDQLNQKWKTKVYCRIALYGNDVRSDHEMSVQYWAKRWEEGAHEMHHGMHRQTGTVCRLSRAGDGCGEVDCEFSRRKGIVIIMWPKISMIELKTGDKKGRS